jgi:hypothetical protein
MPRDHSESPPRQPSTPRDVRRRAPQGAPLVGEGQRRRPRGASSRSETSRGLLPHSCVHPFVRFREGCVTSRVRSWGSRGFRARGGGQIAAAGVRASSSALGSCLVTTGERVRQRPARSPVPTCWRRSFDRDSELCKSRCVKSCGPSGSQDLAFEDGCGRRFVPEPAHPTCCGRALALLAPCDTSGRTRGRTSVPLVVCPREVPRSPPTKNLYD